MKVTLTAEQIAKVVHEANKAYCEVLGDGSQIWWDSAPQWQKDSAIAGIEQVIANPEITPEQLHQEWYDFKAKDGWIYGEIKNVVAKTHPCMVPYTELPEEQKLKDSLFSAIVKTLIEGVTH